MKLAMIAFLALVLGPSCSKQNDAAKDRAPADNTKEPTSDLATKPAEPAAKPGDVVKPVEPAAKPADSVNPVAGRSRAIPNASGLFVDAPSKWLDNGVGGGPGMHLANDGGLFVVLETSPEQAAKNFETMKKELEQVLFKKWLTAEPTADGYKLLYIVHNVVMKGDEAVKEGSRFAFQVRRKIGDKLYDCSGAMKTEEDAKEGFDLCTKIAAN